MEDKMKHQSSDYILPVPSSFQVTKYLLNARKQNSKNCNRCFDSDEKWTDVTLVATQTLFCGSETSFRELLSLRRC